MPKGHKPLRKISGLITFKLEYQRHLKVKTQPFGIYFPNLNLLLLVRKIPKCLHSLYESYNLYSSPDQWLIYGVN